MDIEFKVINWNIGAAKPLKQGQSEQLKYRKSLSEALTHLIEQHRPHVITLQETIRYAPDGNESSALEVVDFPKDYNYFPHMLIDSQRHSNRGKWRDFKQESEDNSNPYLGQGNGLLIHKEVPLFPLWSLPNVGVTPRDLVQKRQGNSKDGDLLSSKQWIEVVQLETGLYFGNRDTEPRCAQVAHMVLSDNLEHGAKHDLAIPVDIFLINLHLTTLSGEREGIPDIDEQAVEARKKQLDIVFNGIVSRYNNWRRDEYKLGRQALQDKELETTQRHEPIWIVSGDFNFTRESYEYELIRRRNFGDLLAENKQHTKASGVNKNPTLTVDYVFAGPLFVSIDPYIGKHTVALNQNRVIVDNLTRGVSDHYPIFSVVPISLPDTV